MNAQQHILKGSRRISDLVDDKIMPLPYKSIAGDSHVTEPPELYRDYLDPKFRDRAPHMEIGPKGGSIYVIEGIYEGKPYTVGMGTISAAGVNPKEIKIDEWKFEDIHKGGYEPEARIAAQDRDGLGGEVIFPSVGMVLCNHPDADFKQACVTAYNRWLQEFQPFAPGFSA